jgi:hypothetical protein
MKIYQVQYYIYTVEEREYHIYMHMCSTQRYVSVQDLSLLFGLVIWWLITAVCIGEKSTARVREWYLFIH